MKKFNLTAEHKKKRLKSRHVFSLRYDIFGSFLHQTASQDDYFDFCMEFPDEASKIIIDGMYSGDWFSVYESEVLPMRHNQFLDRLREGGVDIIARHISAFRKRGKECWITHRISEVDVDMQQNPHTVKNDHPDWFIPAFDRLMNNMSVPELCEHKIRVLSELVEKYDIDGLDIDFERHTPILPPGKQWEMRECVTDFMRSLRRMTLEIAQKKGRVIMLSARVPDCLLGAHEDGLDVERWIDEELIDGLTLGSRSFDVHAEEFRALSSEIFIYGCYDPHHTVDGYTFPPLSLIHGVWHSHLSRGADGVEYFNWSGEGKWDVIDKYIKKYDLDRVRDGYVKYAHDDFTGANDTAFLRRADKTYPVERRGGYPWGVGYGNMNAHSPLPMRIDGEGEVKLYVSDRVSDYSVAEISLLFGELDTMPEICLENVKLECEAQPARDPQVTEADEAPVSGYGVSRKLLSGEDDSYRCTRLTATITGMNIAPGYVTVRMISDKPIKLEKLEISLKNKKA